MNSIFILDLSGGNICRNNYATIQWMIDEIAGVDPDRKFILKFQLFERAGNNIPLFQSCFVKAYEYAEKLGYQTTASVFDINSLNFLMNFDVPFIKIANRPELYHLIGEVPRKIPVLTSVKDQWYNPIDVQFSNTLACVSNYPAKIEYYEKNFSVNILKAGISDHTEGWDLFEKYLPRIYECHFCLEHDNNNPDAGPFARTPEMLKKILGVMK